MSDERETIVAEISKSWCAWEPWPKQIVSQDFEDVIEANRLRGYRLSSWKLTTTSIDRKLVETIVAVFERVDAVRDLAEDLGLPS